MDDVFRIGEEVNLFRGDCLEILPTLEAYSVDAIITDLPYGTTACAWDEVIPFARMWEWVEHVLKTNGVFVTTAQQPFSSKLVSSNYDHFRYEWVWKKNNPTDRLVHRCDFALPGSSLAEMIAATF